MYYFILSIVAVVAAFILIGMCTSRKVRTAGDYAVAGRTAGPLSVASVIMGALVAGGSTIGTVQLAYISGLSGWWFTLGSGIGCALLGLRFAGPVRRSGFSTLPEFIERSYGWPTALLTMISSILGTLLSMVSQFIAGISLIRSVFPVSVEISTVILALMILAFIFMGGLKSYSAVSGAKTVLLYVLLAACCVKIASMGQTPGTLIRELPFSPWLNPFGRGVGKDLGACFSLVLGILCTQIYMQAVFAASDERTARNGCLTAAVLIPPLGLMGIWIGLGMYNAGIVIEPAQALPYLLKTSFHPAIGGALWAGLAITVVGGAAGLTLGIATNLTLDVFLRMTKSDANDPRCLYVSRVSVLFTVALAATLGLRMHGILILQLSYLGMGLRGAGMVVPLIAAILRPGLMTRAGAFVSSLCGLGAMLLSWALFPQTEPLYPGIVASLLAAWLMLRFERKRYM